MRREAYRALLKAPIRILSATSGILGFIGSVWPDKVKDVLGTDFPIQAISVGLLALAALYFAALWLLKPGDAQRDAGVPISRPQTTNGPQSHNIGQARDVYINHHPPPVAEQPRKSPYGSAGSPWDDPSFTLLNIDSKKRSSGQRDTPLADGIVWVLTRRWEGSFGAEMNRAMGAVGKASRDVRQAAADGEICIWGKPSRKSVHVKIAPDFWVDHQPEWMGLISGETTTEPTEQNASSERFFELMVSRAEFTRKWRPRWTGGEDDGEPGESWKTL